MLDFIKKPAVLGLVISLVLAIIVMWFYFSNIDNKNYTVIDNPTDKVLHVEIDETKYTLAPFQTIRIDFDRGPHYIIATQNDSVISKGNFTNGKEVRALINPTLSKYVIYKQYYSLGVDRDSLFHAHQNVIDSAVYYGESRVTDSLYIKGFYLNVDQPYPKIIKNMDTISGIPKIFRLDNFKKFYQENFN